MSKKITHPPQHAANVSAGQQALAKTISTDADRRALERTAALPFVAKITDDEWAWALEQIRNGDTDANIARHLGISKGGMAAKRRNDPDFAIAYAEALEDAFITIAQETRDVARGSEGYSSGDVQRDRLIVETDLKLASKFARKILGDKLDVEHKAVVINVHRDEGDLC